MSWQLILALIMLPVAGIMWHIGGSGHKWVRSFLLPIFLALAKFAMVLPNVLALLYAPLLMAAIALFSYGLSAPIHILWVLIFGGNGASGDYPPVEFCTRATCGFLWSLAAIPFAIVTGDWIGQIIYSVVATVLVGVFGLVDNVEVSEGGTGATVATCLFI